MKTESRSPLEARPECAGEEEEGAYASNPEAIELSKGPRDGRHSHDASDNSWY